MKPKTIGNFLIAFSLISTLYIYYPLLKLQFAYQFSTPSQNTIPKSTQFGLVIDKINVNEIIYPNIDPFNKTSYLPILHKGLAHAKGSSLPSQDGNIFIFGHSSDNPFSITRYNTSFYLLDKLQTGDQIKLYHQDQEYLFQVTSKQTVKPYQVEFLTQNSPQSTSQQLILQTCTPVGTSINRLLVFATPIQS